MYGPGRMGYAGGRRFGGRGSPALVVALVLGGLFLFSAMGPIFHFFPFVLLFWLVPFVLAPMIRASYRGVSEFAQARERGPVEEERKERQLLEALERHGEISPARAALETTLTVAEADRMLSRLAKDGHVEVRAREGRLGYALWDQDRRELDDGS